MTKPRIVFANEHAAKMLQELFKQEKIHTRIVVFGQIPGLDSFDDILKEASTEEIKIFQCYPVKNDDNSLIMFTSGSTGLPKGIQHTYRSLYYNMYRFHKRFDEKKTCITMFTSALSWMSTIICIMRSLLNVFTAVTMNSPTTEEICKAIEKYKVQWIFLATGVSNDLVKSGLLEKYDFSTLEVYLTGGSKVQPEVAKKINSVLKNGKVRQGYGLTELGQVAAISIKDKNNYDSSVVLSYDLEMKIVDVNTKKIMGPNEQGEICLRQELMMKHYFNNPKATEEAIDKDGWLHSGDLGYYDEEGNIFIVDRIKDMFKYRGHHISPYEIERILLKHPNVLEAAVVPVPHPIDEEHPLAFIVTRDNQKVSEEELLEMTSILGDIKKLRGGIKFLETLPKTPTEKIDKIKLKEMAKACADK